MKVKEALECTKDGCKVLEIYAKTHTQAAAATSTTETNPQTYSN